MKTIYMDNAATSFPKAEGVGEAMADYINKGAFNVGRGGYEAAYLLSETVVETREMLLELFDAPYNTSLIFTQGATASINQFLKGLLCPGDHVITTSVEHNAVMRPLRYLESKGTEVTVVPCDGEGKLDTEDLEKAIKKNTKAVITTHASNVSGTLLPIGEIGEICRSRGIFYGVDAAQSAGVYPISMNEMKLDFVAFPGHKGLLGPQGIGGFAVRDELAEKLIPIFQGGTGSVSDSELQPEFLPDKFESGTLPLPGIMGLHKALLHLKKEGLEAKRHKEEALTTRFLAGLHNIPGIRVAGISDPQRIQERASVVSLDFLNYDNAFAAFDLEQDYGILTRVGLHCAPEAHRTLGTFPRGTVRFSFGPETTFEEIDFALRAIKNIAGR